MTCNHNYTFSDGYFECTKCGHMRPRKSRTENNRKIGVGIGILTIFGIVGFLYVTDVIEFNPDNLPEPIQDAGKLAKELASETTTVLRTTINENVEPIQLKPIERLVSEIKQIPEHVKEKNPLNEKPEFTKSELEIRVHQLTNQQREQFGLKPLILDEELSNVARGHSKDMANRNYFDHVTPEGLEPTDRAKLLGYECEKIIGNLAYRGISENILQNNLYDSVYLVAEVGVSYEWNTLEEIATTTVDGWMHSSGHRENILNDTYDREGIGVWIAKDDKVYITQNFC